MATFRADTDASRRRPASFVRCLLVFICFALLGLQQMQSESRTLSYLQARTLPADTAPSSQEMTTTSPKEQHQRQQQHLRSEPSIARTDSGEEEGAEDSAAAALNSVTKVKSNGSKPTFVFYVGLPKTATSFLQCTLSANLNKTEPILLKDNYEYIGTCPYRVCGLDQVPPSLLRHRFGAFFKDSSRAQESMGPKLHTRGEPSKQKHRPVEVSPEFMERVHAVHRRGHNGLMVYEGASSFPDDHIATMSEFLQPLFDVEIVIGYRPLYEWLPSKYNSVHKRGIVGVWPGESWKGGRKSPEVRPFDIENRGRFSIMFQDFETVYHKHPTEIVRDNFQLYFPNVKVLGQPTLAQATGKGDPILEQFFCHIFPDAPQVCQEVIAGSLDFPTAKNPSVSLDEDILAVAAYKEGPVRATTASRGQRRVARDAITEHLKMLRNQTGYEYPLECWSQEKLDRLERLSLALEHQLFDASWLPGQEEAHRDGFAESVAKHKFCHIDTAATLEQPEWKSFFESIKFQRRLDEHVKDEDANAPTSVRIVV